MITLNIYMYKYTNKSYLNNAFNATHDMQSNTKTNKNNQSLQQYNINF